MHMIPQQFIFYAISSDPSGKCRSKLWLMAPHNKYVGIMFPEKPGQIFHSLIYCLKEYFWRTKNPSEFHVINFCRTIPLHALLRMTLSYGSFFRVTDHLRGNFIGEFLPETISNVDFDVLFMWVIISCKKQSNDRWFETKWFLGDVVMFLSLRKEGTQYGRGFEQIFCSWHKMASRSPWPFAMTWQWYTWCAANDKQWSSTRLRLIEISPSKVGHFRTKSPIRMKYTNDHDWFSVWYRLQLTGVFLRNVFSFSMPYDT